MNVPISRTPAWQTLTDLAKRPLDIRTLIEETGRVEQLTLGTSLISADLSKQRLDTRVLDALLDLAQEADVSGRALKMAEGTAINETEHRAVLHTALRQPSDRLPAGLRDHLTSERNAMLRIATAIRDGSWQGSTGRAITDVVNIGIGGSDLGPKMACAALREFCDGPRCHFISNVDGAEINTLLTGLDAATTVMIISSKTFTTVETLTNARTMLDWFEQNLVIAKPQGSPHCIGVTNDVEKAKAFGIPESQLLTFIDAIGGRYSVWSSIGLPVAIATGAGGFEAMLAGGAEMDAHFQTAEPAANLPLLMGLIGVWYNNFLGMRSHAVIPYCQRLSLFVDHLQQLDMESNGKSATLSGDFVEWDTGPVVWGQTGTNGQHAFFQLLHQGTQVVPVDFIGLASDPLSSPRHHRILMANMIAQSEALMLGRSSEDPHRHYPGNRPSTTILLDALTPASLGQLLALYEHKVFVQGCVWQVNSFDQWGVELGKQLATSLLEDGQAGHDPSTTALMKKTGLHG
ncbi:MAG: glucose-6-phosphate isomerase [Proteobacteria bacterium]|nr:glucose-6-phosphate isomerase [Pseudomonadota bacterium]